MRHECRKQNPQSVIGLSLLVAAWMIGGAGLLGKLGIQSERLIELLTFVPAVGVIFMFVVANPGFLACERRTFKRILGLE